MKSYLDQLDNNESILLMYLADELPARDRAAVEQMLASDAGMRAELLELRRTQEQSITAMEMLDRTIPTPISPALAVRQVVCLINQNKLQKKTAPAAAAGRRFAWWMYAMPATAAAVLLFVLWTIYGSGDSVLPSPTPQLTGTIPTSVPQTIAGAKVLSPGDKAALLATSFDLSDTDDSENMKLVAVGNRTDDAEFPDPARPSDSKPQ